MRDDICFIHMADPHFGFFLKDNFRLAGILGGFNPHDDRLLDSLEDALLDACDLLDVEADQLPILLTDDLTAAGTDNDFAVASGLMFNKWTWRLGEHEYQSRTIGLDIDRARVLLAPGNHDHWAAGNSHRFWSRFIPKAYDSRICPFFFPITPWRNELVSASGRLSLMLYGIDSNSGFLEKGSGLNLRASGSICDEDFQSLSRMLANEQHTGSAEVRVRAFACHHAFESPNEAAPLEEESRLLLQYLAGRFRVHVALTGHTHVADRKEWIEPRLIRLLRKAFKRLGWLDHSGYDPDWALQELCPAAVLAGIYGAASQGFYVHRLTLDESGKMTWSLWNYQTAGLDYRLQDPNGETIFTVSPLRHQIP